MTTVSFLFMSTQCNRLSSHARKCAPIFIASRLEHVQLLPIPLLLCCSRTSIAALLACPCLAHSCINPQCRFAFRSCNLLCATSSLHPKSLAAWDKNRDRLSQPMAQRGFLFCAEQTGSAYLMPISALLKAPRCQETCKNLLCSNCLATPSRTLS